MLNLFQHRKIGASAILQRVQNDKHTNHLNKGKTNDSGTYNK